MPLLAKELELHPGDLFSLQYERWPWSVAHTRSRQEKVLARALAEKNVPFYLPQIEKRRVRAGRNLVSHLPLFSGYVFVRGGADARDVARRSGVVVAIIDVDDQQRLDGELRQIRELQLAGASLELHDPIETGDVVKINDGVFRGYRGIVLREKGRERLLVELTLLRKAVAVEFARDALRRSR